MQIINGLEKEPFKKQKKYADYFSVDDIPKLRFTGVFKFVDTGKLDILGNQIFKKKRVFQKLTKIIKHISSEQREEIDNAFFLFDKDKSGTIDVAELRDAMKALGIFLKKDEVKQQMVRVDKDGSGCIDRQEFIGLMSSILSKRNQDEEIRKVFRCYDNDDTGYISKKNLIECADVLEMYGEINDENVQQMIEMGEENTAGSVDLEGFMNVMYQIGLITREVEPPNENSDIDKEYNQALANHRNRENPPGKNGKRGRNSITQI